MPDAITEYLERFVKLEDEGFKLVFDRDDVKKVMISLNTEKQLFIQHIDSEGNFLYSNRHDSEVYSKLTELLSGGIKQAGTRYTLKASGVFYDSWMVTVGKDFILIDANPIKKGVGETDLFEEYGDDIVGLTDESFDELFVLIRDVVVEVMEGLKR